MHQFAAAFAALVVVAGCRLGQRHARHALGLGYPTDSVVTFLGYRVPLTAGCRATVHGTVLTVFAAAPDCSIQIREVSSLPMLPGKFLKSPARCKCFPQNAALVPIASGLRFVGPAMAIGISRADAFEYLPRHHFDANGNAIENGYFVRFMAHSVICGQTHIRASRASEFEILKQLTFSLFQATETEKN